MSEHERPRTRLARDAPSLTRRALVIGEHVVQGAPAFRRQRERAVIDEDARAAGEFDHALTVRRVAGEGHRLSGHFEPVAVAPQAGEVLNTRGDHTPRACVVDPARVDLMNSDVHCLPGAYLCCAVGNVHGIKLVEERACKFSSSYRTEHPQIWAADLPAAEDEARVLHIVVRVVVREEQVPNACGVDPRTQELVRGSEAAVDWQRLCSTQTI